MNNLINNFNNNVRGRRSNSNNSNGGGVENNGGVAAPFTQNEPQVNLTNDTIVLDDSQQHAQANNRNENDGFVVSMNMFNSQGLLDQNVFDDDQVNERNNVSQLQYDDQEVLSSNLDDIPQSQFQVIRSRRNSSNRNSPYPRQRNLSGEIDGYGAAINTLRARYADVEIQTLRNENARLGMMTNRYRQLFEQQQQQINQLQLQQNQYLQQQHPNQFQQQQQHNSNQFQQQQQHPNQPVQQGQNALSQQQAQVVQQSQQHGLRLPITSRPLYQTRVHEPTRRVMFDDVNHQINHQINPTSYPLTATTSNNVLLEQLNQVQLENERLYAQLRIRQIIPTQVDKDEISSARKLIPVYSGKPEENLTDWIFALTRYFTKANITEDVKKVDFASRLPKGLG
jgi:hypothetical protein